ncbi:MAG: YkgJ family cysteine cluster protein [Pseudomonadales bacterium]|jgi:Fe-S-cluster containining protein|nr:YkgJ family cysteine cluster protein [Pseudomonadales bacterium]
MIKFRTVEEAKAVQIPELPRSYSEQFNALEKIVRTGNENSVSKLRKIYALTDMLTAFVAPYMVCQKGCAHCCRIDVLVSSIEAQYIERNLGVVPRSSNSISSGHSESKKSCPFLSEDSACSIYEYRPFACRTYHAVDDPALCEDMDATHVTYTSKSNGTLNKLFYIIGFLNGNRPIRDIRDFFPNGRES